jgi:two-component system OmpR family response regulator
VRVLVVEDAPKMSSLITRALREHGYAVDVQATGQEAVWLATEIEFDAVVLDLGLPDISGLDVCRQLRAQGRWMPILMLTGRDAVRDLVHGLDAGADDYLTKPFAVDELRARLRALVRRVPAPRPAVLQVSDLVLDPAERTVCRAGQFVQLAAREFAMLEYLMRHPGQVISRSRFLEHVWDFAADCESNIVDVYIRLLRQKVDLPFGRRTIQTIRGTGYRLIP